MFITLWALQVVFSKSVSHLAKLIPSYCSILGVSRRTSWTPGIPKGITPNLTPGKKKTGNICSFNSFVV